MMKRAALLFLLMTVSAPAQFAPFAFWKSAAADSAFTPWVSDSLVAWYKADAITAKSDGDTLYAWRNSGVAGGTLDMVQLTDSKKPTFKTTAFRGKPSVYIDGSNDYMYTDSVAFNSFAGSVYGTVLVAAYGLDAETHDVLFSTQPYGASQFYHAGRYANQAYFSGYSDAPAMVIGDTAGWRLPAIWVFRRTTDSILAITPGGTYVKSAITNTASLSSIYRLLVGTFGNVTPTGYYKGYIAEIMVLKSNTLYSRVHKYRDYLKNKYGL